MGGSWGSCELWRKARRGSFTCVGRGKVGRGAFSSLGPFYVPGCVVPLLVGVWDASFELYLVRESGIGSARFYLLMLLLCDLYCACAVKVFVADYECHWTPRIRGMFKGASSWDVLRCMFLQQHGWWWRIQHYEAAAIVSSTTFWFLWKGTMGRCLESAMQWIPCFEHVSWIKILCLFYSLILTL